MNDHLDHMTSIISRSIRTFIQNRQLRQRLVGALHALDLPTVLPPYSTVVETYMNRGVLVVSGGRSAIRSAICAKRDKGEVTGLIHVPMKDCLPEWNLCEHIYRACEAPYGYDLGRIAETAPKTSSDGPKVIIYLDSFDDALRRLDRSTWTTWRTYLKMMAEDSHLSCNYMVLVALDDHPDHHLAKDIMTINSGVKFKHIHIGNDGTNP